MKIASSVYVVTIALLVYIYFFNKDLMSLTKIQKKDPPHTISIDSPFQSLVQDQSQYPNLPIDLWMKHSKWSGASNGSDAQYRKIFNLQFSNNYWQVLESTNGTFQLLNAYYDNRILTPGRPMIRILGMINTNTPTTKTHCLLWYEDLMKPILTPRMHYHWMWRRIWTTPFRIKRPYEPFMLSCRIPSEFQHKIPYAVSVVENQTLTPTNMLKLIYIKPWKKKQFAVCVKGLDFLDLDISVRLVEWIELLKILGADNVYFYNFYVHPNISKVLQHYQALGYVHIVRHSLPGEYMNFPFLQHKFLYANVPFKRFHEVILYNDCLYRNLYSYKYIVLLDVDEMIIPRKTYSWSELMRSINPIFKKNLYSLCTRVGYFLDNMGDKYEYIHDIPKYLHMLQHVYRNRKFARPMAYTKCFHNPNFVISLHNHIPFAHYDRSTLANLPLSYAVLHHFRRGCVKSNKVCRKYLKNSVRDISIWKYKDKLIHKSINTLKELKFFGTK